MGARGGVLLAPWTAEFFFWWGTLFLFSVEQFKYQWIASVEQLALAATCLAGRKFIRSSISQASALDPGHSCDAPPLTGACPPPNIFAGAIAE